MKLDQLPEDFTADQFMQLDKEELNNIPFDTVRWQCMIKMCNHFTRMRDYGLRNEAIGRRLFYHKRFVWVDTYKQYFICGKHWKRYKGRQEKDIPFKRLASGHIPWGGDCTGPEEIVF